jgi:hypothetical protein
MTSTILEILWMVLMMTFEASHVLLTVDLLQAPLAYVNRPKMLLAKVIITNAPVKRMAGSFKGNIGTYAG